MASEGHVTDIRDDGSAFQRHGVIVEFTVDDRERFVQQPRYDQFREAVDLVKFMLAVEPLALQPLLLHRHRASLDEEELRDQIQSKTPIEMQLRIEFTSEREPDDQTQQFMAGYREQLNDVRGQKHHLLRHQLITLAQRNKQGVPGFPTSSFDRPKNVPVSMTLAPRLRRHRSRIGLRHQLEYHDSSGLSRSHVHRDTCGDQFVGDEGALRWASSRVTLFHGLFDSILSRPFSTTLLALKIHPLCSEGAAAL